MLYRLSRAGQVGDLLLPAGTISLGYFWTARPYNIYHWLTPTGQTLGLYANLGDRTRITPEAITWRDLVVDVLLTPDGRCQVLDEDELPPDLNSALRARIARVRDELLRHFPAVRDEIERRSATLVREVGLAP
ncbi:MAG: DUF402 domain-containing protein [Thermomicrobiales bacterium]